MKILLDLFPGGKRKALTVSYDDGTKYDRRLCEIFNNYGIRGSFHLNSGFLGDARHITAEEIPVLYRGHEVSAHTAAHPTLTAVPRETIINEITGDRRALESACGYPVRGMSYPNGAFSESVIAALRSCGIEYSRTTISTGSFSLPADFMLWHPTCHHNEGIKEKLETFLTASRLPPLPVFYVWGHSYEFNGQDNWQLIEEFSKKAGGRDDIWYATNIEIADYICAVRSLRFGAACDLVYNPTAVSVWISADGEAVKIGPGETKKL
jgi:peptidoglycan/xylan/chitin deacetylase (PgdA/CDA1 family)